MFEIFDKKTFPRVLIIICIIISCGDRPNPKSVNDPTPHRIYPDSLLIHLVDLKKSDLAFYLKDEQGKFFHNHKNLKSELAKKGKKLTFAVNGGMYNRDHSPQGLYIENGRLVAPLDTQSAGYGNFYLQPNGVFYLTKNKNGFVKTTSNFQLEQDITFATQSGPMLVIDGKIHPVFREGSKNLNIRNGVGVLPDGRLLFVMSKTKINLYNFANFFKKQGCQNALYLDGFVSRTYLPEQDYEEFDGKFGVIIGETEI